MITVGNRRFALFLILPLVCGTVILSAGCGSRPEVKKNSKSSEARIRLTVRTADAVRKDIQQIRVFSGVLEPMRKVDLAPSVPGKVSRIHVEIGDRVAKDQILAQMDDALLATTSAQFQPVKAQYERMERLYANKTVSRVQFEQAEAQYVTMKRQIDQIQENTVLKAPFAGVVTDRTAEEGEMYAPKPVPGRSSGLIQITQLDPLKVDIDVDEATVARIKKGMNVSFLCDALPDSAGFTGTVLWINPAANSVSRTFMVRISVVNRDFLFKPGYFVRLSIPLGTGTGVLAVPSEAVVDSRVYVVRDSFAIARSVKTGISGGGAVEILEGLREGETVVISGNRALPDTALVETTP